MDRFNQSEDTALNDFRDYCESVVDYFSHQKYELDYNFKVIADEMMTELDELCMPSPFAAIAIDAAYAVHQKKLAKREEIATDNFPVQ